MEHKSSTHKDIPELNQELNFFGKIASYFIKKYKVVFLFMAAILLIGISTYNSMPKEILPDVSLNVIVVNTIYPGGSVEDIENLITDPLESRFTSVEGLDKMESDTENGSSLIKLWFEDGTDMIVAETEVNNEVRGFILPEGAYDPYVKAIETGEIPIISMTLTGDYDLIDLKTYADRIQDEIEGVAGVRNVDIFGGYEREIQVILDFNKMMEYGLDADAVKNALQYSNINLPAGDKELDSQLINIRVDEAFKSVEEIENLIVSSNATGTVFLKDIAEVKDSHKDVDTYSYTYIQESSSEQMVTPTINLKVYRETGYDVMVPCEEIKDMLDAKSGVLFPSDITVEITSDQSVDVGDTLSDVLGNAFGGLIVVIMVLYIFIGLNEALIVSSVIPFSLLITILVMNTIGLTINSITLTGFIIALGLLVDNAIVVMENVDRLREQNVDKETASKFGINQVGPAIFAATLTTVLAFIPVAMTPGTAGKFLSSMPKVIISIILASLLISMVVTPTLCAKFLSAHKKKEEKKSSEEHTSKIRKHLPGIFIFVLALLAFSNEGKILFSSIIAALVFLGIYLIKEKNAVKTKGPDHVGFIDKYCGFLHELLENNKKKIMVYVIAVAVLITSIATIPAGLLKLELFPEREPSSVKIEIEMPVGTLLKDTRDVAFEIEKKLYNYEDIESFIITVGNEGAHKGQIDIELVDKEIRQQSGFEMVELLKEEVGFVAGADIKVKPVTDMDKMSSGAPVSIGLKGDDFDELEMYAEEYFNVLETVEGIENPEISIEGGLKELIINIDNNKAAFYGLNIAQVSNEIRNQISGAKIGIYKENSEEYDISLYYSEDRIDSVEDFDKLFFKNYKGEMVNFHDIAVIEYKDGMSLITREDGQKIVFVEADVQEGYNDNEVMRRFTKASKSIQLPSNIERVEAGNAEELNKQLSNMGKNFMIAILLVYIVLVFQFNSLGQPIVILLSVPFSIIGVIWGLILTGNNLGFYAMFGIVALVGIAVNEAIVLIDFTNYNLKNNMPLREAIVEAVKIRIVPVLATSLTTMGGVLPLALYNETFSQLGCTLIFGLFASAALTLLLIPLTYYGFNSSGMTLIHQLMNIKLFKKESRGY